MVLVEFIRGALRAVVRIVSIWRAIPPSPIMKPSGQLDDSNDS